MCPWLCSQVVPGLLISPSVLADAHCPVHSAASMLPPHTAINYTVTKAAMLNSFLFAVVNHGVSEELVAEVFEQNRAFFALPDEQKRLILADNNNRQARVLPHMLQACWE